MSGATFYFSFFHSLLGTKWFIKVHPGILKELLSFFLSSSSNIFWQSAHVQSSKKRNVFKARAETLNFLSNQIFSNVSINISGPATRAGSTGRLIETGSSCISQKTCINDAIRLWNQLPLKVTNCDSMHQIKKQAKMFAKTIPIWIITIVLFLSAQSSYC